ncbi:MAG: hypothetical protein ACYDDU_16750 [Dermatophilaceae bacterium]
MSAQGVDARRPCGRPQTWAGAVVRSQWLPWFRTTYAARSGEQAAYVIMLVI